MARGTDTGSHPGRQVGRTRYLSDTLSVPQSEINPEKALGEKVNALRNARRYPHGVTPGTTPPTGGPMEFSSTRGLAWSPSMAAMYDQRAAEASKMMPKRTPAQEGLDRLQGLHYPEIAAAKKASFESRYPEVRNKYGVFSEGTAMYEAGRKEAGR